MNQNQNQIQLTEWFTNINPVHIGVYEVEWKSAYSEAIHTYYNYWNGTKFRYGDKTAEGAASVHELRFPDPTKVIAWRGVKK